MALEAERADDRGIDRRAVRQRRTAEARRDLGRPRAAADALGPLEHERFRPAFARNAAATRPLWPPPMMTTSCMASSTSQRLTTDTPTRENDNPLRVLRCDSCVDGHRVCPRIRRAQFRPGAPMMPPPGCVADPHIHRFRIGVLYCAQPGAGRRKNSCSSVSSP